MVILGPGGVLHKHRKLMPTMQERLFHGVGAGDDLAPVETPLGRIGGLICWENRMPLGALARLPGRAADLDRADRRRQRRLAGLHAAHRHRVGSLRRLGPAVHPPQRIPRRLPAPLPDPEVFGRGGAAIVEPTWGNVIAGPLYGEEGIVVADCDLRAGAARQALVRRRGPLLAADVLGSGAGARAPGASAPESGEPDGNGELEA